MVCLRTVADQRRAERDVVDEMAVHDVEVQPVGAGDLHLVHLVGKAGEVGGEEGGRD